MDKTVEQWNAEVEARKQARHERRLGATTGRPVVKAERKPGAAKPFKRAQAMFMQILALKQKLAHNLPELQIAINSFPPYVSRGHGWRGRIKNRTLSGVWRTVGRSKYVPHQGKSEMARRVFQALPAEQKAFIRRIEGKVAGQGDIE